MPPHGSQTANAIRQDLGKKGHVVTWVVALGWRLWEHLSRCRTWSGGSGTRSTLTGASPTAHLGGHPEGGRTREEGYPARARTPRGLAWKLGELEGHRSRGPSHLRSPPASLLSRSAGSCLWSLRVCLQTPDPLQSRARGGGLCQQTSQGQTGPWGLSLTQRAPPPLPQRWLQSSLTGPYPSPGHHMPPHRPHLLPSAHESPQCL